MKKIVAILLAVLMVLAMSAVAEERLYIPVMAKGFQHQFWQTVAAGAQKAAPKPVVMCGDFNVAHQEIDLKNPGPNRGKAGFSDEEREKFTKLLDAGFTDTFRKLHPDVTGAYSWWSYRFKARQTNAGWRIDYFLVSDQLAPRIEAATIHNDVFGSDHCPVGLELAL